MAFIKPANLRDESKRLVLKMIENALTAYSSRNYPDFFNSVEAVNVCMYTYKDDPTFNEKLKLLAVQKVTADERLKRLSMITGDTDTAAFLEKVNFYLSYLTFLHDLANRTIFAGKDVDVDINLTEVFKQLPFLYVGSAETKPIETLEVGKDQV